MSKSSMFFFGGQVTSKRRSTIQVAQNDETIVDRDLIALEVTTIKPNDAETMDAMQLERCIERITFWQDSSLFKKAEALATGDFVKFLCRSVTYSNGYDNFVIDKMCSSATTEYYQPIDDAVVVIREPKKEKKAAVLFADDED